MTARYAQLFGQTAAMALAFGVGLLVGQQFCVEEPEKPEPKCTPETQVVEVCHPEDPPEESEEPEESEPAPSSAEPREVDTPTGDQLPEASKPASPEERQRLLGWARGESSTLQGCPRDRGKTYRLAISLELDAEGNVDAVSIDADDESPASELDACLHERIADWTLPDDLDPPQRPLFFRLTL